MINQIERIRFGIMGDEDIRRISVCEVNKYALNHDYGTVYDPRLGCVTVDSTCATCCECVWKCPGHFGHIELNTNIILFYKACVTFLKLTCLSCHRFLSPREELKLNDIVGIDRCIEYISKQSFCFHCKSSHPDIKLNTVDNIITSTRRNGGGGGSKELKPAAIKSIFVDIPDEDVLSLGIDVEMFHPRKLVLSVFPVIPVSCRPRVITSSISSDDDLSLILADIIKNNHALEKYGCKLKDDETSRVAYDKALDNIKLKTLAYCDNSKGRATHNTNHKPMTGIKERITKKSGIIRQNLMGKRCDKTARTVVGPDPTLRLDEVAVPRDIANSLTTVEYVTHLNFDEMSRLVNDGKATTIIKSNGTRIDVAHASVNNGTLINHGDELLRTDGERVIVNNCKMSLRKDDRIVDSKTRETKLVTLPSRKFVPLQVGDRVERYLRDGDYVLINRQPTLHRNSIQGMKIVVKPGKTIRLNLSIVTGFNMDFDGDEGNLFTQDALESKAELMYVSNVNNNILSWQYTKSEIVIVQDSLLAAYLMTRKPRRLRRDQFFNLLMYVDSTRSVIDYNNNMTTRDLFAYIIPHNFSFNWPNGLRVHNGRIIDGYLDKSVLKSGRYSIVRLLYLEYGKNVAAKFVDNVQFLTNAWLETEPFSIGIGDCVRNSNHNLDIIHKYFLEAENASRYTDNALIRESRINRALNKAKDIGLRLSKESLDASNKFIDTISSGSKGDYFNIAQITGLLGQQNLKGNRPKAMLDNRTRTLIHYPHVIVDSKRLFESRGFITSSFIGGMNAKEMFFHAMTGREGMINTATGTASSGYIQRCCIKLNEDLKIAYDGTVRDANNNIYQFIYGGHGFDPSLLYDGVSVPINIARIVRAHYDDDDNEHNETLSPHDIEYVLERCEWKRRNIPSAIYEHYWSRESANLRRQLNDVRVTYPLPRTLLDCIIDKYNCTRITPGECVGVISAQSIGERQTQTNLNTFHTAGKFQENYVERFEEILNMSRNIKYKKTIIYFRRVYDCAEDLRDDLGSDIVSITLKDVIGQRRRRRHKIDDDPTPPPRRGVMILKLNIDACYEYRVTPTTVVDALINKAGVDAKLISQYEISLNVDVDDDDDDSLSSKLDSVVVCGTPGITSLHLDYDGTEWYAICEGSNFLKLIAHPLVDARRLYCNNLWEIYDSLGISYLRKVLYDECRRIVCSSGVNDCHVRLLVDKMTFKGRPTAITRYSMRTNDVGPLSKATFEECTDILINAAINTDIENNNGVSASIISGNQPKIGTGMMGLRMDLSRF